MGHSPSKHIGVPFPSHPSAGSQRTSAEADPGGRRPASAARERPTAGGRRGGGRVSMGSRPQAAALSPAGGSACHVPSIAGCQPGRGSRLFRTRLAEWHSSFRGTSRIRRVSQTGVPRLSVRICDGCLLKMQISFPGLVGASSPTSKGCGFSSQSGDIPRLRVPSPVTASAEGNRGVLLPLSDSSGATGPARPEGTVAVRALWLHCTLTCCWRSQELEKLASRKLRISAKETMRIAEKLYTQG